jgi:hypothetical protein
VLNPLVIAATATSKTGDSNPLDSIRKFFRGDLFLTIVKLVALFVFALWLSSVFWTFKDARRRLSDPFLIIVAVATSIVFPFFGILIYILLRPPEYLDDVRERELEIRAMERRLGRGRCPTCRHEIQPEFLVCPTCATRLKEPCRRCRQPLELAWRVCPHCETPTPKGEADFARRQQAEQAKIAARQAKQSKQLKDSTPAPDPAVEPGTEAERVRIRARR